MTGAEFRLADIRFALLGGKTGAIPLAIWETATGRPVTVGLALPGLHWSLLPAPAEGPHELVGRRFAAPSVVGTYGILAVAVGVLALGLVSLAAGSEREYAAAVRGLGTLETIEDLDLPDPVASLQDRWTTPGVRSATRLMSRTLTGLQPLTAELDPRFSPSALFARRPSREVSGVAYFHLAVLTGDIPAALDIVAASADEYEDPWSRELLRAFWQPAVEALHELDFGLAQSYAQVYLATTDTVIVRMAWTPPRILERTRTLAQILLREFESGRIYGLCDAPGVHRSFGRLQEDYRGYPLPDTLPGLSDRRAKHAARFCQPREPGVRVRIEYDRAIAALADQPGFTGGVLVGDAAYACDVFPRECEFHDVRRLALDHGPGLAERIAWFGRLCDYLVDDVVGRMLLDAQFGERYVDGAVLARLLPCALRPGADYRGLVSRTLSDMECDRFLWPGRQRLGGRPPAGLARLLGHCV